MTEQAFPTPPAVDPFLPAAGPLATAVRERQRAGERLAFRTAVAAADGGAVTLSSPDSIGGRKAFPSPWLLELAARPACQSPLLTSAFVQLTESRARNWLRVVSSGLDATRRSPGLAGLEEHRLQAAAASRSLLTEPIALRPDLPLGRGLQVLAARASADLTEFEGNLAETIISAGGVQRLFAAAQVLSASGIESWATCPFRFFLGRVLRVQPTQRPDDAWSVDPLERGLAGAPNP